MKSTSPSDEEPAKERAAGFVLFRRRNGRRLYLVLRHRVGGHWAFPKGRVESDEDELAAALREVAEETGIRVSKPVPGFHGTTSYRLVREGRPVVKRVDFFLAEAATGRVRLSEEHSDAAWLGASEARQRLTYDESRRLLDEAEARLGVDGRRA